MRIIKSRDEETQLLLVPFDDEQSAGQGGVQVVMQLRKDLDDLPPGLTKRSRGAEPWRLLSVQVRGARGCL